MSAAAAAAVLSSSVPGVVVAGAAVHAIITTRTSRKLSGKSWDTSGRGGFIGSLSGEPSAVPAAEPAAAPAAKQGGSVPIGGSTGKKSETKSPFGVFRKHKPTKLPKGCPKPYDAKTSP